MKVLSHILLVPLLVAPLWPQSATTGTLQGTVTDSSGGAVPGVALALRNLASGATRSAQSDDSGQFRLAGVPAGTYLLRAERDGFNAVTIDSLAVSLGQTVTQQIVLTPAGVTQRLDVQERADALEPEATTESVALGGDRIEEAPAANRNYLNFVLSAPGVTSSAGANTGRSMAGVRNPANDSGFVFNGMRARNNSISIDGVDNRDETTGGNRVAVGLEMVEEFRVAGTSMNAEFGGAAGGLVNVVTHTGQNIWHGDTTFFFQNEALNARNPEVETSARPLARRYQPGVSAGGPAQRDKTFFFFAVEQSWESAEEWPEVSESAAAAIRRALASPQFARSGVRTAGGGLFPARESDTEGAIKASRLFGDHDTVSARYAFSRGRVRNDVLAGDNPADESARGSSLLQDHSAVFGWLSVLGSSKVSDLRVQWSQRTGEITPNSSGPMYEIPGVLTLGQSNRLDQARTERHAEVVESFQWTAGRHLFSAGASLHRVSLDSGILNGFHGTYVFPSLADFVMGKPDLAIQAFGDPRTGMNTTPAGFWFQDHWQAAQGLTIEAGLRYDKQRLPAAIPPTSRNVAPRIGIAWHPAGASNWVFRAGAGLFYDRYPLAYLNEAIQKDGLHGFEQYLTGADAQRVFVLSQGGTLAGPLPGIAMSTYRAASLFRATYSEKVTAGAERRLDKDTTLAVEFSHVRGLHLPRIRNAALTLPPRYELEQTANSVYNGLCATLNRRLSKEITYLVSYNVSGTHDDGSDYDEQPMDPGGIRKDWALSRQHQRHRLSLSGVFEIPNEELPGAVEWLKEPLDHVTLAPVLSWGSGPLNTLLTTDVYRTGAYPISARPAGFARNSQTMPRTVSLDLRVMKTIPVLRERARVQFGAEAFNLLNHTNRLRVSPYYTGTFGALVEAQNPRQVQLMFQFEY